MYSIIGAILLLGVTVMTMLVALGLPLGEYTMGGQHKILPKQLRVMAELSIFIQIFALIIILQSGEYMKLLVAYNISRIICYIFAVYLSINTLRNLLSNSKKEKYVMAPLSLITAICFWITGLQM